MTSTAFLIVDVQNDFVTGSLPVPGGAAVAAARTVKAARFTQPSLDVGHAAPCAG